MIHKDSLPTQKTMGEEHNSYKNMMPPLPNKLNTTTDEEEEMVTLTPTIGVVKQNT